MTVRTRRRRVICFVDDDPNELMRFARAMEPRFDVIAGTSYAACRQELERRKLATPDLWVLDLYFPNEEHGSNSPAELSATNAKYLRLHQATAEFHEFLDGIGQGVAGGVALIEKCKNDRRPGGHVDEEGDTGGRSPLPRQGGCRGLEKTYAGR